MVEIQRIRDIAINEVVSQTWGITQQLLSVNGIVFSDGAPVIEDLIFTEEGTAVVYFPIVNEPYYFVVYVDLDPVTKLRTVGVCPGNTVAFVVASSQLTLEELTGNLMGVELTTTWRKGETIRGKLIHEDSGFEIKSHEKNTGEVEDKIQGIIKLIERQTNLRETARIAEVVQINIGYFGYTEWMSGIHLDAKVIQDLAELGVSVDIDLYASGPALP
jgi:hypothetical protein